MNIPFLDSGFKSFYDRVIRLDHKVKRDQLGTFGLKFLDCALRGIFPEDLVLVGAPSGQGKTQFCANLALSNARLGRRVHFFALEAATAEIEWRMKYNILANRYYADPNRISIKGHLNYVDWYLGEFERELAKYEVETLEEFHQYKKNLFSYYRDERFNAKDLEDAATSIGGETDLMIIDHAHFFDFDDDNENKALKKIASTCRNISQLLQKPIILVAHVRKGHKQNSDCVPGIEDFHGSSDLYKISTKAITLAKGEKISQTRFGTLCRIVKNRMDMSVCHYIGQIVFDNSLGRYEDRFSIGQLTKDGKSVDPLLDEDYPYWSERKNETQTTFTL